MLSPGFLTPVQDTLFIHLGGGTALARAADREQWVSDSHTSGSVRPLLVSLELA